jgi:hypothetical protein
LVTRRPRRSKRSSLIDLQREHDRPRFYRDVKSLYPTYLFAIDVFKTMFAKGLAVLQCIKKKTCFTPLILLKGASPERIAVWHL